MPTRRFQKKKMIVDCSETLVPSGGMLKIVPQNPNLKQSIYVFLSHGNTGTSQWRNAKRALNYPRIRFTRMKAGNVFSISV